MSRYRFSDFVLSPRRRLLLREGREQPLIPRYFDLLVFLIEHRGAAVHRRDIFDAVWTDVVVSDSALSQAVRTIRRVLDDDPREPRFVRTVSRHGYQFVWPEVVEEDESAEWPPDAGTSRVPRPAAVATAVAVAAPADPVAVLLAQIANPPATADEEEEQRDAAERLHAAGTAEALRRLPDLAHPAFARALLRDTRWDTPEAGAVPIFGTPGSAAVVWHLVGIRLRRTASLVRARWAGAAAGGALAGAAGGVIGGLLLIAAPGSDASPAVLPVLAAIGAACGAVAAAGIGAGLAVSESVTRSWRTAGTVIGGALGGGIVGLAIELLSRWSLDVLVGNHTPVGGGIEGVVIGAAAAFGYGTATRRSQDGTPAPRGRDRARVAFATAMACAVAALLISITGRPLVGGTIHAIAQASAGRQALLSPLGRLIGEPGFGPITAALIATGEGLAFGSGLALGLTRRGAR